MKRSFAAALILSTTLSGALVSQDEWTLDRSHSSIGFSVTHLLVSTVPGQFNEFEIRFTSSREDYSDATVTATIDVSSLDTRNERRDRHLRTDDFFGVASYPTISFVSTRFQRTGEGTFKIYGDLTIRDSTRSVVFDARLNGVQATPQGMVSGWSASLTINRFDYGLKWDRTMDSGGLIVSEDVGITIHAEFRRPAKVEG